MIKFTALGTKLCQTEAQRALYLLAGRHPLTRKRIWDSRLYLVQPVEDCRRTWSLSEHLRCPLSVNIARRIWLCHLSHLFRICLPLQKKRLSRRLRAARNPDRIPKSCLSRLPGGVNHRQESGRDWAGIIISIYQSAAHLRHEGVIIVWIDHWKAEDNSLSVLNQ